MSAQTDTRLVEIAKALKADFDDVSLRGSGDASFVFVQTTTRAVEASIDNNRIWVEFWDSVAEFEPVPSSKETTFDTVQEAQSGISKWLAESEVT